MKIDQSKLPPIFGSNQRKPAPATAEDLKTTGVAFASYGIAPGETIEFPENIREHAQKQPTVVGGQNMQILVPCMRSRDGKAAKESWFSMGSLVRQDGHREYTCEFTKDMGENYSNHDERMNVIANKAIKGTDQLTIEVVQFDTATRRPVVDPVTKANVMVPGRATKIEFVD